MESALQLVEEMQSKGRDFLSEHESKNILRLYGIPVAQEILVSEQSQLEAAVASLPFGFPIVMKVDSADIQHKTEARIVRLGIQGRDEAARAYPELIANARAYNPNARINGLLLQEMVTGAVAECIVGLNHDAQFGPVIMFGLGGVWVEVLEDVTLRLPPFDEDQAEEMIREIKAHKLLDGYRGAAPADIQALRSVLVRMSDLALDLGDKISEIDINPVCVLPVGQGVKAVDALIRLRV